MAQSPPAQSLLGLDHWILSQGWGWAGHSDSTSPASSSSDSSGSCPCDGARGSAQPAAPARSGRPGPGAHPAGRRSGRPGSGARQSASEREKLRMRTLARALHELRRFLPPSVAPAGQSLTKIETLRLAIRYIGHLSAVLGLGEDGLQRRRRRRSDAGSPRGCPLCPAGGSGPARPAPRALPQSLESSISDADPWGTPLYCPSVRSPPPLSAGRAPDARLWTPPQACPGAQMSAEPRDAAVSWTPSPASPELAAMYQSVSIPPESCLSLGSPSHLPLPTCQRLQPQLQWGSWGHNAEMLPSSEDQDSSPALQLSAVSPSPSSGLQLSGCPEVWQEDLEGTHLGIFY